MRKKNYFQTRSIFSNLHIEHNTAQPSHSASNGDWRNFFPYQCSGQLFDLGVLGYGLDLRFWVMIAIIVSLTLTITLITTLTIILP